MSTITAGTGSTNPIVVTGNTDGTLVLKTNDTGSGGTAAVTLDTSQNATFSGKVTSATSLILASNGTTTAVTITTAGGVAFGTSGSAYGTSGQVLTSAGNAPPTWSTPTGVTTGKSIAMAMIFGF